MKRYLLFLFIFLLSACQSKTVDAVHIIVNKNSIQVSGLSAITLQGIKRDSMPLQAWQSLFPVSKMPADTDMKDYQPLMPGKYQIIDSAIVFTPDTAFQTGQTYLARYYRYDKAINAMDLVLRRRALGRSTYTELIFKY